MAPITLNRPTRRRRVRCALVLVAGLLIAAGCTSDAASGPAPAAPDSSGTTATTAPPNVVTTQVPGTPPSTTTAVKPVLTCAAPADTTPVAAKALGNGQDYDITSFDGTVIRAHWFPLPQLGEETPSPTVLMGPGWGSGGDTDVDDVGVLGAINIASLRDAGYNVLTWDPRGFGESTGTVTIDSVDYEGRDVQQLIDWVATLPGVALDAERDPQMGMVGGSYGGGIQLITAAADCRIDAIVPVMAWNLLTTSLYKNETPKAGWANLLVTATFGASLDPTITRAQAAANATGTFDPADAAWLADRGPGEAVSRIRVPTLLIQGTVDTLFTLDEAIANYGLLGGADVPTAMLWFCGGHGICLTDPGDPSRVGAAAIAWLDRYVKDDSSVDTGPGFEFVDQDGVTYSSATYDTATGEPLTATGTGTLALVGEGGAGPAVVAQAAGLLGTFVSQITPGRAANAVNVSIAPRSEDAVVAGAPELTVSYTGTPGEGERPTRVFAQLVDDSTGLVIGNQITPIEVVLDGRPHTAKVPLEAIGFTVHPDAPVTLQLVATTVAYSQPQTGGSIVFDGIAISLPVMEGLASG